MVLGTSFGMSMVRILPACWFVCVGGGKLRCFGRLLFALFRKLLWWVGWAG